MLFKRHFYSGLRRIMKGFDEHWICAGCLSEWRLVCESRLISNGLSNQKPLFWKTPTSKCAHWWEISAQELLINRINEKTARIMVFISELCFTVPFAREFLFAIDRLVCRIQRALMLRDLVTSCASVAQLVRARDCESQSSGKRRGFSPETAARHSQSARAHTDSNPRRNLNFSRISKLPPNPRKFVSTKIRVVPAQLKFPWIWIT